MCCGGCNKGGGGGADGRYKTKEIYEHFGLSKEYVASTISW